MKKQEPEVPWGAGYVVPENHPYQVTGKILTLLEVLGLPAKQEQSFKDLVHQHIWEIMDEGFAISCETNHSLREKHQEMFDKAREAGTPPTAV